MRAFSYILVLIPLVTPFAAAEWYVDFFKNGCTNKILSGRVTVSGTKTKHIGQCVGGPQYQDGSFNTRSIHVAGLSGTGLELTMYAARGCDPASAVLKVSKDGCYVSSEMDPLNYLVMRKK